MLKSDRKHPLQNAGSLEPNREYEAGLAYDYWHDGPLISNAAV
jgi:hypothetical protein